MMPACTGPTGIWCRPSPSDRQEGVGAPARSERRARAERMRHAPEAEIEPGPRVGQADGLEAVEIADRALQPDRRRMQRADRRKASVGHSRVTTAMSCRRLIEQRHMHGAGCRPTGRAASQRPSRELAAMATRQPSSVDDDARPRPVASTCCALWRSSISAPCIASDLSEQLRDVLEPGRPAPAADRRRRRTPARDARTSAHRRPSPRRSAPRGSPNAMALSRRNSAPKPTRSPNTSRIASSGSRAKVEVTTRNSLMKMPSGGSPAMATTPSTSPQPSTGWVTVSPPMSAIFCVPLTCAMWPTAKKIADLVSDAWSCAAARRNWRAARPCRRRRR